MIKKIIYIIIVILMFTMIFSMNIIATDIPDIKFEYDEIGNFSDGMAWVRKDDKYGYIDKSGNLVIPMIYNIYLANPSITEILMNDFSESLASVSINGKCGFIDKTGTLIIPAIYDGDFFIGEWVSYVPMFNNGLARVKKDDKFGYINKAGEVVVPFEYSWAGDHHTGFFTEGLIKVSIGYSGDESKCGFLDTSGNVIVPLVYKTVLEFSNGLAAVQKMDDILGDNWGFIDKTGKLVIPFKYNIGDPWTGYSYFNEYGFAIVWNCNMYDSNWANRTCGIIDRKGNLVVPYKYKYIEFLSDGVIKGKIYGEPVPFNRDDSEWEILD